MREQTKISLVKGDGRVFADGCVQLWVIQRNKLLQTLEDLAPSQRKAVLMGLKYNPNTDCYARVSTMVISGKEDSLDHRNALLAFCEKGEIDVITCLTTDVTAMGYFVLSD